MRVLSSIVRGADAGALGTLATDTLLYRHYRDGGGQSSFLAWESILDSIPAAGSSASLAPATTPGGSGRRRLALCGTPG